MHGLIVHAHPEPQSFNGALTRAAVEEFLAGGHTVEVSDLYAEGFNPVAGRGDFLSVADADVFHYQNEQSHAARGGGFSAELQREQDRVRRADVLILQFPLWWGGPPAILKGWFDRVLAYGFAYVDGRRFDTGAFRGKHALMCVTTGGTVERFTPEGTYGEIETVLRPVRRLVLDYMGFKTQTPFVSYAAPRVEATVRELYLRQWRDQVRATLVTAAAEPRDKAMALDTDRDWRSRG